MHSSRYEGRSETSNVQLRWEDARQQHQRQVEISISDDEDLNVPSVFKKGGKGTETSPLDLSIFGQDTPNRQVESPLDLSVKTRKRCADSTEHYGGDAGFIRGLGLVGPPGSKRMCLNQGGDMELIRGGGATLDPRYGLSQRLAQESVIKSKLAATSRPHPVSQGQHQGHIGQQMSVSQPPFVQQQQQQQQQQQLQQQQQQQQHQQQQQGLTTNRTHIPVQPSPQYSRPRSRELRQTHVAAGAGTLSKIVDSKTGGPVSNTAPIQSPQQHAGGQRVGVKESAHSESTNLKGFFEQTTQKHVVVRNFTAYPSSNKQSNYPQNHPDMIQGGRRQSIPVEQMNSESRAGQIPPPPGLVQATAYMNSMNRSVSNSKDRQQSHPSPRSIGKTGPEFPNYIDLKSQSEMAQSGQVIHFQQGPGGAPTSSAEQRGRFPGNSPESFPSHRNVNQGQIGMIPPSIQSRRPMYPSSLVGTSLSSPPMQKDHGLMVMARSQQFERDRIMNHLSNEQTEVSRQNLSGQPRDTRAVLDSQSMAAGPRMRQPGMLYSRPSPYGSQMHGETRRDSSHVDRGANVMDKNNRHTMAMSPSMTRQNIEVSNPPHPLNTSRGSGTASATSTMAGPLTGVIDIYKTNARELGLDGTGKHPFSRQSVPRKPVPNAITSSRGINDHPPVQTVDRRIISSPQERAIRMSPMHFGSEKQSLNAVGQHTPNGHQQRQTSPMDHRRLSFVGHPSQTQKDVIVDPTRRSSQEHVTLSKPRREFSGGPKHIPSAENLNYGERSRSGSISGPRNLVEHFLFGPGSTGEQSRDSSGKGSERTGNVSRSDFTKGFFESSQSSLSTNRNHSLQTKTGQLISPRSEQKQVAMGSPRDLQNQPRTLSRENSSEKLNRHGFEREACLDANRNIVGDPYRKLDSPRTATPTAGRSIIKGTSGIQKDKKEEEDFFDAFVLQEYQKDRDNDSNANDPFANRSILEEIDKDKGFTSSDDRSASTASSQKNDDSESKKACTDFSNDSIHRLPLKIAIPGGNTSSQRPCPSPKRETDTTKTPKIWSRKHMILSAVKQDKELKDIVDVDNVSQPPIADPIQPIVPVRKREDKSQDASLVGGPSSPKMPILSPQEKPTVLSSVSTVTGDPPNLEEPRISEERRQSFSREDRHYPGEESRHEINNLEKHLHKLISDAVKGQGSFAVEQKELVCENVYRELKNQPSSHKPFPLSRQLSQSKNIPIANVAPIVHGRNVSKTEEFDKNTTSEVNEKREATHQNDGHFPKSTVQTDTESANEPSQCSKTLSLCEPRVDPIPSNSVVEYLSSSRPIVLKNLSEADRLKVDSFKSDMSPDVRRAIFQGRFPSPEEKKGQTPVLRVLKDGEQDCDSESVDNSLRLPASDGKQENTGNLDLNNSENKQQRNVFGAFREILSKSGGDEISSDSPRTTEARSEEEVLPDAEGGEHSMDVSNGYDGDDESRRLSKNESKRNKQSTSKCKTEKAQKRTTRHSRNEEQRQFRLRHKSADVNGHPDDNDDSQCHAAESPRRPSWRQSHHEDDDAEEEEEDEENNNNDDNSGNNGSVVLGGDSRTMDIDDDSTTQTNFEEVEKTDPISKGTSPESRSKPSEDDDETTEYEDIESLEEQFKIQESLKEKKRLAALKKKRGFHFKQKYIFQKKRRGKGRTKGVTKPNLSFFGKPSPIKEKSYLQPDQVGVAFTKSGGDEGLYEDQIPVPPELRRIAVNKETGETLLHRAARLGYEEVALYCLASGSVNISARDNAGYTPLHECAVHGNTTIAYYLMRYGADVNCPSLQDGVRPIHDAIENDRLEMVRLLLAYGADPTVATYSGRTPLKMARTERMKRFLQKYFGDLNGYGSGVEEKRWTFKSSCSELAPEENPGCLLFGDVPSDPEDETGEICTLSSKPQFPTHRLTDPRAQSGGRTEDYIMLDDILQGFRVSKDELESLDISPLLLKTIPYEMLQKNQKESVFYEKFAAPEGQTWRAVRCVDAAQVINKVSKYTASRPTKRTKS